MRADRLLILASHLENVVDPDSFFMPIWKASNDSWTMLYHMKVDLLSSEGRPPPECGFVACAMGHACLIPSFQKAGLKMGGKQPVFDGWGGYHAADKFFGLYTDQSMHLFSGAGRGSETPKETAARIRQFVKEHSNES